MKQAFSRPRRFLVVLTALAAAALLFRSQVAQALVVRGDDLVYSGNMQGALVRYARALRIDPDSSVAADRYVFGLLQRHTNDSLQAAVSAANTFLLRHPSNSAVLADRAMCYILERRYERARDDFERAARASSDARDYAFAGWAAAHGGDIHGARVLWRRASMADKRYAAASVSLAEHVK